MSYKKERAIAEAATPGKRDVIERRAAIGVRVWRDGKDYEIADYYESMAEAEFAAMCTREFVLGLLDRVEAADRYEKGLRAVQELINESEGVAGLHLNGDVADWDELLAGGRFEEWLRDFSAALNPTEVNGCAACRREGRCDTHLRLDIEATEANDD